MNTIERNVYINSLPEIERQSPAYRIATPAPGTKGIDTNKYNQSWEYTRSARAGSSDGVKYVNNDGATDLNCVNYTGAGLRPALNLIYNPKSPREARPVTNTVYVWDEQEGRTKEQKITKHVTDVAMADGTVTPMQIDNWEAIQTAAKNGTPAPATYQLKSLHALKGQRFNAHEKGNDYDGSEIDMACGEFYNELSPEVQSQVVPVIMDKDNNYEITGLKTAGKTKQATTGGGRLSRVTMDARAEEIVTKEQELTELRTTQRADTEQHWGQSADVAPDVNKMFDIKYKNREKFTKLKPVDKQSALNELQDMADKLHGR